MKKQEIQITRLNILITGGAGFIGSSLIERLIKDHNIVCIDNFNDSYNSNWKEDNVRKFLNKTNFRLHRKNITNYRSMERIFKDQKFDKIIHLAARAGVRPSIEDPLLYQKVNVEGTINLLELAKLYKVPHFIYASSSSVYGNQEKVPFSEADCVNEPVSPYAATKKASEMLCYTYAHLHKIKMTCLRFFTVYGPKGRPDMAPYLFTEAITKGSAINKFGDGTSSRDYTYIDDVIDGIMKAIDKPFDFEVINLGNNNPVKLNEFIKTLENITGKTMKINQMEMQPGDVMRTYADVSKAKKLLDWEPSIKLEDGLKELVEWYKKERR